MSKAVLGLGTNLGDRVKNLSQAIEALNLLPNTVVLAQSQVYQTAPFDVPDLQPDYLNQCVLLETALSPHALLGACLGIEAAQGRKRVEHHGARVLDLDLLLYAGKKIASSELTLPHPGILERAFVMVPLRDLFPDGNALGIDFLSALQRIGESGVAPLKNK